jgi:Fe-S cluster assembly ATP-binding protein
MGQNLLELEPDERSRAGLFLCFQYPHAVPGVTVANFLRRAVDARREGYDPAANNEATGQVSKRKGIFLAFQYPTVIPGVSMANFLRMAVTRTRAERAAANGGEAKFTPREFRRLMKEKMGLLKMDDSFATRYLNEGFSGGEKKRAEIRQLALLEPELAIMDETDSGLDIDALRIVSDGVNSIFTENMAMLVITHYQRLLNYIKPHFVHVMMEGRVIESGGPELALELEEKGYDWLKDDAEETVTA